MKIKISEVWNDSGKSKELTTLETNGNPWGAVYQWISDNRPDLSEAKGIYSHGFHAAEATQ